MPRTCSRQSRSQEPQVSRSVDVAAGRSCRAGRSSCRCSRSRRSESSFTFPSGVIAEEILGAGQDRAVPEDDQRVPEERAGRIGGALARFAGVARPVVVFLDDDPVEGQALEPLLEGPPGAGRAFLQAGLIDELDERLGLVRPELLLDLEEADDVPDRRLELGVDPDALVGLGVEPVDREGELVETGGDEPPRLLLVEERPVGVEAGDEARRRGRT